MQTTMTVLWRVFAAALSIAALPAMNPAFAAGAAQRSAELDMRHSAWRLDGVSLLAAREARRHVVPDLVQPLADHNVTRLRLRVDGQTTIGDFLDVLDQLKKTRVVSWELFINKKRIGRFPNKSCAHDSIDAGIDDFVATDLSVQLVRDSAGTEAYCLSSGP